MAFDMSVSVTGERLEHLRGAGQGAVLDGLRAGDQAELLTFSRPRRAAAGTFTVRRGAAAHGRSTRRGPVSSTALSGRGVFTATTAGGSTDGRNLVLLFSDGVDTVSWLSADQALSSARRANVVVYSAAVRGRGSIAFLRELARQTGGDVIEVESTRDLRGRFQRILEEFRQRYLISYTPSGVERGGWHDVAVRVKGRVRHRTTRGPGIRWTNLVLGS